MRSEGTKTSKGYWRVRLTLTDEFGRKRQKGFEGKTLADAKKGRAKYIEENGLTFVSQPETRDLKELFEEVDRSLWSLRGEDHRRSMHMYRNQWVKLLGGIDVGTITTPTITKGLATLTLKKNGERMSRSSASKLLLCIRQAFDFAVSDLGWLESNPAEKARIPSDLGKGKGYPEITTEEYERMLALADSKCRLLLRLIGECGMRPKEARKVRPEHLFSVQDRWLVKIPESKTEAGRRVVPVSDSLAREIESGAGVGWEGIADPGDHLRHWWRDNSKTRLYDLRGWCSDQWRRRGIPDQVRTHLMGHTDPRFTQRVYESITSMDTLNLFRESGKQCGADSVSG